MYQVDCRYFCVTEILTDIPQIYELNVHAEREFQLHELLGLEIDNRRFPNINVDVGICVIFKFIYLKFTKRSSELQKNNLSK